jgi:hypothetical protein
MTKTPKKDATFESFDLACDKFTNVTVPDQLFRASEKGRRFPRDPGICRLLHRCNRCRVCHKTSVAPGCIWGLASLHIANPGALTARVVSIVNPDLHRSEWATGLETGLRAVWFSPWVEFDPGHAGPPPSCQLS